MLKLNDSVQKEKHKGTFFLNELEMFVISEKNDGLDKIFRTQTKENGTEQVLTQCRVLLFFFYEW